MQMEIRCLPQFLCPLEKMDSPIHGNNAREVVIAINGNPDTPFLPPMADNREQAGILMAIGMLTTVMGEEIGMMRMEIL